jgi:hypothetical protein
MNEDLFWELIDAARLEADGEIESQVAALEKKLSLMSLQAIVDFQNLFVRFLDHAYDERLWAAGNILDELSDDCFHDFRAWLISRGKDAYFRCLDNPESLADIVAPGDRVTAEEMNAVPGSAYRQKTGQDVSELFSPRSREPELKNSSLIWKTPEGHSDPERLCALYPKLCALFGKPW